MSAFILFFGDFLRKLIPFSWMIFCILLMSLSAQALTESQEAKMKGVWDSSRRLGLYSGLTMGYLMYTGKDRINYKDGPVFGLKMGYDFLPYVGIEASFRYAGLESTDKGNVNSNLPQNAYNSYQLIFQAKGAYPVTKRLRFHLGIGGGVYNTSPNMFKPQSSMRGSFYNELGLEYFTRTRGMSIGLDPSFSLVSTLKSGILQLTGFIRYTF